MCKSLWVYPLIMKNDEKQKILFNYGVCLKNREEAENMHNLKLDFLFSKFSDIKLQGLKRDLKKNDFKEFVKFVNIPCGCCSDCLKDRSRQWAIRILKEAELYKDNYFVTLTYDDEHLPKDKNLVKDEISKFNKKLKTYLARNNKPIDFRFYAVGEYGSKSSRCHYHVIYFNLQLDDLKFYKSTEQGDLLFNSEFLSSIWSKGHVVIGAVDVGSASYVARYCDKKRLLTKDQKQELEAKGIVPEFSVMSRKPGIGAYYMEQLENNLKNGIYMIPFKDNNYNIPLYYSKKLKAILEGTPELDKYLDSAKLKQDIKISNDFKLSDIVFDVQRLYEIEDCDKLKMKKIRDF